MDLFGTLRKISGIIFKKDTYTITIQPIGTRTKDVTYSLPVDTDTAVADEVLVTEDHATTLTRKTLETTSTIIKDAVADKSATLLHNAAQPAAGSIALTLPQATTEIVGKTTPTPSLSPDGVETVTLPVATDTLVGTQTTNTLTNKTIDADNNTITNIGDEEIKAGVDAAKLADGSVSNDELQRLDGVTSSIQTQINDGGTDLTNHESSTVNHGTTGDIVGTTDTQTLSNKTVLTTTSSFKDGNNQTKTLDIDLTGSNAVTDTTLRTTSTANRTVSLPDATDTLVGIATADTLTNKTLTSPVLNTGVSGTAILDEDTLSSDSDTQLATQQSIKAYVDNVGGSTGSGSGGSGAIQSKANGGIEGDAAGQGGIAIGSNSEVHSAVQDSIAIGVNAYTNGGRATAIGVDSDAGGSSSLAVGRSADAGASNSTAIGYNANASHSNSTAIGNASATTATNQIMLGHSSRDVVIPGTISGAAVKDEDDMISDSATSVATQQSIKAYVDTSLAAGGGGSGETNYVNNPDAAVDLDQDGADDVGDWLATAGTTVTVNSTPASIPRYPTKVTSIKIQATGSGAGSYASQRLRVGQADRNKKLKLSWVQIAGSSYVNDYYKVELYTNTAADYSGAYTEVPLTGDVSGDSFIKNYTGSYLNTFSAGDEEYYELRFVRVSAAAAGANDEFFLNDVIVGPGSVATGAVVGPWESFTPSWTGFTTSADNFWYRRVGDSMEIRGDSTLNSTVSTTMRMDIPAGLTINSNLTGTDSAISSFGTVVGYDLADDSYDGTVTYGATTNIRFKNTTSGAGGHWGASLPFIWASGDFIGMTCTVPITEWQDTGTLTLGQVPSIVSPWTAYTPTIGGFGSESGVDFEYRRVGTDIEIRGEFTGGVATTTASFTTPTGLTASLHGTDDIVVGELYQDTGDDKLWPVVINNSNSTMFIGRQIFSTTNNPFNHTSAVNMVNSVRNTFFAKFGVAEWSGGSQDTATVGISGASATELGLVKYSEGRYTPTYGNTTNSSTPTVNDVFFHQIGKLVTITGRTTCIPSSASSETSFSISLPTGLTSVVVDGGVYSASGISTWSRSSSGILPASGLVEWNTGGSYVLIKCWRVPTNTTTNVYFTLTYRVN